MKVFILGEFSYQSFPEVDGMVEVDKTLLDRIGIDKKFDTVNKTIVDYDDSARKLKEKIYKEINELKAKLRATDYKAIKFAEGVLSDVEYEETKAQRQAWRDRVNTLEEELQEK